jgi:hypothetical protein
VERSRWVREREIWFVVFLSSFCAQILKNGELQVSREERDMQQEQVCITSQGYEIMVSI